MKQRKNKINRTVWLLVVITIVVRLLIGKLFLGGYDQEAWDKTANLVLAGENPYVLTRSIYSFSPLWMGIITILKKVNLSYILPVVIADAGLVYLIYKNTKKIKYALIYVLSPISIYVTSLIGNFDPLMVLFLLLSYLALRDKKTLKSAIFFSIAILFKQAAVLILPAFLKHQQNFKDQLKFALIALVPFFLSLLPFYINNPISIQENVLTYQPGGGWWGYDVVLRKIYLPLAIFLEGQARNITLILMAWYYFLKQKGTLINDILILFTGFYFFKSVSGAQYLSWLLPFALISGDVMFNIYHLFTSTYLIIAFIQGRYLSQIPGVGFISLPAWIISGVWFRKLKNSSC